jgi:hypothetical protein
VAVKRIKPNILSERFDESRSFYTGVMGLEEADGLDWILFFGTDRREVQLSVMALDIKAQIHPDISIEVDDVAPKSSTHRQMRSGDSDASSCVIRTEPSSTSRSIAKFGLQICSCAPTSGDSRTPAISASWHPHHPGSTDRGEAA